jgi:hypothetical protein
MGTEDWFELCLVKVGSTLGLWKSEVKEEQHLEKVVERNPKNVDEGMGGSCKNRTNDGPRNEPLGKILNAYDTGKHRPIH